MVIEWAGLGPEVLLRLDRERGESLGSQLQRELREAIRAGRLSAGERLPSSRMLARELGVSRGLVMESYTQLESEGYLSTRVGSATRVAAGAQVTPLPAVDPDPPPARFLVDFRPAVPDVAQFPMSDWLWAIGEAGREAPLASLGYGDPRGEIELREVLAGYLRRVRGAVADPGRIVICSGFAQGLNLILGALARQGVRRVAFEDPGEPDNAAVAARVGLEPVHVPVDERGIDMAALAAADVGAVLLTPAHQTPTGVVLTPERRLALLAWAQERKATILEDDYDAEFRYDRQPVGSIQGLAPDLVAGMSSVSKVLAPALRLGWIVSPPSLTKVIARDKQLADRGSPALDQLALARLIESGRYDRHLRRMRAMYAARRHALIESLGRHAPHARLSGLAAGFHAVVRLPEAADEAEVIAAAGDRSIGLYGMSRYRASKASRPPELVLGFGELTESSIERGIAAIGDLLSPG